MSYKRNPSNYEVTYQIMFSYFLILLTQISAHGVLTSPPPLVKAPSQVSAQAPCGDKALFPSFDNIKTILKPGDQAQVDWLIESGDGSGPLQVQFSTGAGFTIEANVTSQIQGVKGVSDASNKGTNLQFLVPNMDCATGCVMRVRQVDRGFGSCVVVKTGDVTTVEGVRSLKAAAPACSM